MKCIIKIKTYTDTGQYSDRSLVKVWTGNGRDLFWICEI